MKKGLLAAAAMCAMFATPTFAETIKIGFVTSFTGPGAAIGNDMKNAVELALSHIGNKMGDLDVEVIFADDGVNPEKGKQATEQLVLQDEVDIVAGYIWSNVLLASADTVLDEGKILISSNAGPSQLAGERCHENFFNVSFQNNQATGALGLTINRDGVEDLYIIAPDYAAGRNMVSGVEGTFTGNVAGRDMTVWPTQVDWATELTSAKAATPDGLFIFYPGPAGPAFISQYQQANTGIPLYSAFTVDGLSLPVLQSAGAEGVLGSFNTMHWSPDLDNAQNVNFVTDFQAAHSSYPSFYAAQSYDTIFMIKAAVEAVGGNIDDVDAMRAAMEATDFPSVRGEFRFGSNHFPVETWYKREVVIDAAGNWVNNIVEPVLSDTPDSFAASCTF